MVYEADWSLGEIIKAVKEKGELDNTYIIFTADNGSECLPRDEDGHYYSGPLQMGKYSTFEGGIRVPFVVAGPGIKAGSQCDVPIAQWDILAYASRSFWQQGLLAGKGRWRKFTRCV